MRRHPDRHAPAQDVISVPRSGSMDPQRMPRRIGFPLRSSLAQEVGVLILRCGHQWPMSHQPPPVSSISLGHHFGRREILAQHVLVMLDLERTQLLWTIHAPTEDVRPAQPLDGLQSSLAKHQSVLFVQADGLQKAKVVDRIGQILKFGIDPRSLRSRPWTMMAFTGTVSVELIVSYPFLFLATLAWACRPNGSCVTASWSRIRVRSRYWWKLRAMNRYSVHNDAVTSINVSFEIFSRFFSK